MSRANALKSGRGASIWPSSSSELVELSLDLIDDVMLSLDLMCYREESCVRGGLIIVGR